MKVISPTALFDSAEIGSSSTVRRCSSCTSRPILPIDVVCDRLREEFVREGQEILWALAQTGDVHIDHAELVVQILSTTALDRE